MQGKLRGRGCGGDPTGEERSTVERARVERTSVNAWVPPVVSRGRMGPAYFFGGDVYSSAGPSSRHSGAQRRGGGLYQLVSNKSLFASKAAAATWPVQLLRLRPPRPQERRQMPRMRHGRPAPAGDAAAEIGITASWPVPKLSILSPVSVVRCRSAGLGKRVKAYSSLVCVDPVFSPGPCPASCTPDGCHRR